MAEASSWPSGGRLASAGETLASRLCAHVLHLTARRDAGLPHQTTQALQAAFVRVEATPHIICHQ